MMKKNKWKVILTSTVMVAALLLSACGNGGNEQTSQSNNQAESRPEMEIGEGGIPAIMNPIGTLPIVNEPVTLSVAVSQPSGIDFDTNPMSAWFEEQTGVSVEWIQIPAADFDARINLMLATGDLPDIIVSRGLDNHATVAFYAGMDLLRPISPYLEEFAPNLMHAFELYPTVHTDMIMNDGLIYGFPDFDDAFHLYMPQKLWINTAFLEEANMPMPTTMDEFYDTLVAFRDLDSNILPFVGASGTGHGPGMGHNIENILGRFVTTDMENRLLVEDGQVTPVFNTNEWREGLRFLNRMYNSGLIAPETFVQDRAGLRAIGDNPGQAIAGVMPALWLGQVVSVDIEDQEGRWNDYRVIPFLETAEGRRMNYLRPLVGNHRAVITNNLPEELMPVAVRWLDNFYTEVSTFHSMQGFEDVNWRFSDPGEVGIDGSPAVWERLVGAPTYGVEDNSIWTQQPFPTLRTHAWRLSERADRSIVEQETLLYDETRKMYEFANPLSIILPVLIFDEAEAAELVDLQIPINSFVAESVVLFTMGELDIETQWDWYLEQLESLGLPRLLEINQIAYDARMAAQ